MQDWAQAVPTDVRMDKHNKEKKEKRSKISSGRAKVEQPTASLGLTGKYERSTNLTGKYENSEPIADEDSSERFPVMSTALSSVGRFSFFFFFFFMFLACYCYYLPQDTKLHVFSVLAWPHSGSTIHDETACTSRKYSLSPRFPFLTSQFWITLRLFHSYVCTGSEAEASGGGRRTGTVGAADHSGRNEEAAI